MPSDFKIKTLKNNYGGHLNNFPLEEDEDEDISVDDKDLTTVFQDMRESALLKAIYISSAVKGVTLGLNASTEKDDEGDNINCNKSENIFDSSVLQTSTPEKNTSENSVNNSKHLKIRRNLDKNLSPIVIEKELISENLENDVSFQKLLNEIDFQRRLTVDKVMRERIQNMYDTGKLIKESLEHLKQTRLEEASARRLFLESKILDDIHEQEILNKPKREAQWARDNLKEAQRIQERNQKVKDAEEEARKKSEAMLIKRKLIDKILFELQKEYNQEYKNVLGTIKSCKDKPALSELTVVQSKMLKDCALICESLLKKCKQGDVTEDDVEGAKKLVETIRSIHNCLKSEIVKLNNAAKTEPVKVEEVKKTEVEQITPCIPKKEPDNTSTVSGFSSFNDQELASTFYSYSKIKIQLLSNMVPTLDLQMLIIHPILLDQFDS